MSESLNFQPEQLERSAVLPRAQELTEQISQTVMEGELPVSVRMVEPGETADLEAYDHESPLNGTDVLDVSHWTANYVGKEANSQRAQAWWCNLDKTFSMFGYASENAAGFKVNQKHLLNFNYDQESTGQSLPVYEIGESAVRPEEVQTVMDTLELVDQCTGGLLSASPDAPKILLSDDLPIYTQDSAGNAKEMLGFANAKYVYISLQGIHRKAQEFGADPSEILAATVVHEVLGHSTEREVYGKTGKSFEDKFQYSEAKVPGVLYNEVHESVTARDPSHADSKPAREYGTFNSAEDVATTVDSSTAEAMGWESVQKIPFLKSQVDSYRRDIVMEMMDLAADKARHHPGTPGFVGSEIAYTTAADGSRISQPRRTTSVETIDGATAIKQEIEAMAANITLPKELKLKLEAWA